jgi:hypothetical protein
MVYNATFNNILIISQPDFQNLPCRVCKCVSAPRDISCVTQSCDPLTCYEGEEEVSLPGECCPVCQSKYQINQIIIPLYKFSY